MACPAVPGRVRGPRVLMNLGACRPGTAAGPRRGADLYDAARPTRTHSDARRAWSTYRRGGGLAGRRRCGTGKARGAGRARLHGRRRRGPPGDGRGRPAAAARSPAVAGRHGRLRAVGAAARRRPGRPGHLGPGVALDRPGRPHGQGPRAAAARRLAGGVLELLERRQRHAGRWSAGRRLRLARRLEVGGLPTIDERVFRRGGRATASAPTFPPRRSTATWSWWRRPTRRPSGSTCCAPTQPPALEPGPPRPAAGRPWPRRSTTAASTSTATSPALRRAALVTRRGRRPRGPARPGAVRGSCPRRRPGQGAERHARGRPARRRRSRPASASAPAGSTWKASAIASTTRPDRPRCRRGRPARPAAAPTAPSTPASSPRAAASSSRNTSAWGPRAGPQHVEADDVARPLPDAVERALAEQPGHHRLLDVAVAAQALERLAHHGRLALAHPVLGHRRADPPQPVGRLVALVGLVEGPGQAQRGHGGRLGLDRQVGQHVAHQRLVGEHRRRRRGGRRGASPAAACRVVAVAPSTQSRRVWVTMSMIVRTPRPSSPTSQAAAPSSSTSLEPRWSGCPACP